MNGSKSMPAMTMTTAMSKMTTRLEPAVPVDVLSEELPVSTNGCAAVDPVGAASSSTVAREGSLSLSPAPELLQGVMEHPDDSPDVVTQAPSATSAAPQSTSTSPPTEPAAQKRSFAAAGLDEAAADAALEAKRQGLLKTFEHVPTLESCVRTVVSTAATSSPRSTEPLLSESESCSRAGRRSTDTPRKRNRGVGRRALGENDHAHYQGSSTRVEPAEGPIGVGSRAVTPPPLGRQAKRAKTARVKMS
jgi:hypothetical protein